MIQSEQVFNIFIQHYYPLLLDKYKKDTED